MRKIKDLEINYTYYNSLKKNLKNYTRKALEENLNSSYTIEEIDPFPYAVGWRFKNEYQNNEIRFSLELIGKDILSNPLPVLMISNINVKYKEDYENWRKNGYKDSYKPRQDNQIFLDSSFFESFCQQHEIGCYYNINNLEFNIPPEKIDIVTPKEHNKNTAYIFELKKLYGDVAWYKDYSNYEYFRYQSMEITKKIINNPKVAKLVGDKSVNTLMDYFSIGGEGDTAFAFFKYSYSGILGYSQSIEAYELASAYIDIIINIAKKLNYKVISLSFGRKDGDRDHKPEPCLVLNDKLIYDVLQKKNFNIRLEHFGWSHQYIATRNL